jgi:hypothetical protein
VKVIYDDVEFELTEAFTGALLAVMREMCAMMRANGRHPEAWTSGRCYIPQNLTDESPVFGYGGIGDFGDGLGDFSVVVEPPQEPRS